MSRTFFLVAGEHSGDQRGAALIRALKSLDPSLNFTGLGGARMQAAGCKLLFNLPSVAAMGFTDVLKAYFTFRKIFYDALAHIASNRPNAIILIDFPGFNIRLAKKLKRAFPVIYYVSPQLWAWAPQRKHVIARSVDKMLTLFRFETDVYKETPLEVIWVGHPLVDELSGKSRDTAQAKKTLGLSESKKTLGLLPGSRASEIKRILPVMLEAALQLKKKMPALVILLSRPETADVYPDFEKRVSLFPDLKPVILRGASKQLLTASDFSLVCSGTATLEATLLERPFAIVYKTAYLTYLFARNLMQIPYIGIPNVLARRIIVPEFIQHEATARALAESAENYLNSEVLCQAMQGELRKVREELGPPGASKRAAEAILNHLKQRRQRLK